MSRRKKIALGIMILSFSIALFYILAVLPQVPSNDRQWTTDQKVLPTVRFEDNFVHIRNIRNFVYESTATYTPRYYDKTFDLDTIATLDFMLEPFDDPGAAHTLLSFGFTDGSYVSISIEIRKEIGESFSPLKGILREYELTYVIADERDVIGLRANHRKDTVFLYPIDATTNSIRTLFVDMLTRAQKLETNPEFYNTLTSNCILNITKHVNTLSLTQIPWDHTLIFPAQADVYAKKLGLIAQDMTIEDAREKYRINERAAQSADDPSFSKKIRE